MFYWNEISAPIVEKALLEGQAMLTSHRDRDNFDQPKVLQGPAQPVAFNTIR